MSLLDALPSRDTLQILSCSVLLLVGLNSFLKYRAAVSSVQNHPGLRILLFPNDLIGSMLPAIPGVSLGRHWAMVRKHELFARKGWDVISVVWLLPSIQTGYFLADPVAIKEITLHRARFPKPIEQYTVLTFFGQNIVVTEEEEWKKHRKICAPSFSERNNKLVWDESIRITMEMFEAWGPDKSEVVIDRCEDITVALALLIISVAGFGRRIPWGGDKSIPSGHRISFRDALHTVSLQVFLKLIAPTWAFSLSKSLRHLQDCLDELGLYMQEMITDRRAAEVKEERYDLFNALLDANDQDGEESTLSDAELIGNVFIFLIAGHETTAHTLCFVFGLLAIELEEQEKLYQEIVSLVPKGQTPTYDQINSFTYTMAVLYETLRLFPPVPHIPKFAVEDTTLPTTRPDGSIGTIAVRKGVPLVLNATGLHYNPRYWPEPLAYKPSRFMGDWPKDAFIPFSSGGRACLGRRFSETESVAIIALIVGRYKIEIRDPEQYEGLTLLEKREKLLASRPGITTTPLNVPLVFKKR